MTPGGALELVERGHQVWIEHNAGVGAGHDDDAYAQVGAHSGEADCWASDLILKVKEPHAAEFGFLTDEQMLFTCLQLAANASVADALYRVGGTAIADETVEDHHGRLPLLAPMSEVAGRLAVQAAASKRHAPPRTPTPSTWSTASCTTASPTCPPRCP